MYFPKKSNYIHIAYPNHTYFTLLDSTQFNMNQGNFKKRAVAYDHFSTAFPVLKWMSSGIDAAKSNYRVLYELLRVTTRFAFDI